MKKWINVRFDQCDYNETGYDEKNFKKFANSFKRYLNQQLDQNLIVRKLNVGYYYFSGFVEDETGGGYVYFSIPDVRNSPTGWLNNILIRTAKGTEDYSGGSNRYTNLQDIGRAIEDIIGR